MEKHQFRVIVLWVICLIGMMLHFNYHVSKIFYGIDVVRPGATGEISAMAHVMKSVYYHLPMIFIVAQLYFSAAWFRMSMFSISLIYSVSHVLHVVDEFSKPVLDWSQIPLLSLVLIFSVLLNWSSWLYYRVALSANHAKLQAA